MDKSKKSNEGLITQQELEAILNRETLKSLPSLVDIMDENLFINITEFIKHPLLVEHRLSQPKLVEVLRQSPKFHYDNKTGTIKFKEKADRNILIIKKLFKEEDVGNSEKNIKYEAMVKLLIKENNISHLYRIKKIDKVADGFHVVFDHEDISQNVEKFFVERLKQEGKVLISSIIKDENCADFIEDFFKSEILLAAESLKRRVMSTYDSILPSMWQQVQRVNEILFNPTKHVPRRFTHNNQSKNNPNNQGNKNYNSNAPNNYKNNINGSFVNNFPNNTPYTHSHSMVDSYNRNFMDNIVNLSTSNKFNPNNFTNNNLNNKLQINNQNVSGNITGVKTNSVNPTNSGSQTFNKFDLVGLKNTFENYLLPDREDLKPHRHSDNTRKHVMRASFAPSLNSLNIIDKTLFDKKRTSVFSNMSCEPVIEVPTAKEYDMPFYERNLNMIMDPIKEENLLKKNLNFKPDCSFSYSNKEIVSVFFHMNFLRLFKEAPEELKSEAPTEIVREAPKNNLVTLKPKRQSIQKYIARERSKTLYYQNIKDGKRLSSASKARNSFESNYLAQGGLGLNAIYSRKRNTSSSVKVSKRHSNY